MQVIQILFHRASNPKAQDVQQALQEFSKLVQQSDLTPEEKVQVAQMLYQNSLFKSEERQRAVRMLAQLAEDDNLSKDQQLQVATIPFTVAGANYTDRLKAVRTVLLLVQREEAKQHFVKYWQPVGLLNNPELSDIPHIVELAQEEILPTEARDEMYRTLRQMIPQFDKIGELNE